MTIAITRPVSPRFAECELTHLGRVPIDATRAAAQHASYERCLVDLGVQIHRLPAEADLPDSVFVEDTAVVLDELAIITRPGAASRRPETVAVADALGHHRPLAYIEAPATVDGGDILVVGRRIYAGLSSRTSTAGVDQLRLLVAPFGYRVTPVTVSGCLHLKSAVTSVAPDMLLINRDWVDGGVFSDMGLLEVDPDEPHAANALMAGDTVVFPVAFERTTDRLRESGITVRQIDVSELAKAEGGVTCCSVIFEP